MDRICKCSSGVVQFGDLRIVSLPPASDVVLLASLTFQLQRAQRQFAAEFEVAHPMVLRKQWKDSLQPGNNFECSAIKTLYGLNP